MALLSRDLERLRVLLVDDSPEFVQSALRTLAIDPELEVVGCASSGREALSMVPNLRPNLVLMDLAMPGMNGLEATRRIKALTDPPRVVILTLYDDPAYRDAAVEAGADAFVPKAEWHRQMPRAIEALFPSGPADDGPPIEEPSTSVPDAREE